MKRKKLLLGLLLFGVYLLLLKLLVLAEAAGTDMPSIRTLPQAFWYSLVTLSTVGYGDLYPQSGWGMVIGGVFILCSTFLLAFLIGLFVSLLRGRAFQRLRLLMLRSREWYVFPQNGPEAAVLIGKLRREDARRVFLLCGQGCDFTPEELIRLKGDDQIRIFCLGSDGYENYRQGSALAEFGVPVYCESAYEPDRAAANLVLFNRARLCARLYWRRFPLHAFREEIVLIGGGVYAEALLEQALLVNVWDPKQSLHYTVFGDFDRFRRERPYLGEICHTEGGDRLDFRSESWSTDMPLLERAERIILCCETEAETLELLCALRRACPLTGKLYARLSQPFDDALVFGSPEELFTPQLVMRHRLDRTAMAMHRIYQRRASRPTPDWEELSVFLRRSNLASADHLLVKLWLLLDDREETQPTKERCAEAYARFVKRRETEPDYFRRIEHERWMRFYRMNNWRLSPVRDDKRRLHTMLLPYEELSLEDQIKDDYAWELLGALAGEEE